MVYLPITFLSKIIKQSDLCPGYNASPKSFKKAYDWVEWNNQSEKALEPKVDGKFQLKTNFGKKIGGSSYELF